MPVRLTADRAAVHVLANHVGDARVIGLGESAHFVQELNVLRANLAAVLVTRHAVTHLALEVGHDEAPAIDAWLRGATVDADALWRSVGPLTFALYATFLLELADRLGDECRQLTVLGVDLPNSLAPEASLGPLARLLRDIDHDAAAIAEDARRRSSGVAGGSAAVSALAWQALPETDRDAIGVAVSRLRARVDALGPLYEERSSPETATTVHRLAHAAWTTELMLRAMSELFSGEGKEADTSLREHFVATQLLESLAAMPASGRVVYVAHDNHIQKTPVIFDDELVALPAGRYLHRALGSHYVAIGMTHLDDQVPEMVVTGDGPLGFDVVRAPAASPAPDSVEAAAATGSTSMDDGVVIVSPHDASATGPTPTTIRSQSAITHAPLGAAFDAVLVVEKATTDPLIG